MRQPASTRWHWLLILALFAGPVWSDDAKGNEGKEEEDPNAREKREREEREAKKPGAIQIADPGTKVEDSSIARQQIARFEKARKANKKNPEELIKAIQRLSEWDHPEVFKVLVKQISHKEHTVAIAAVAAVARQSTSPKKAPSKLMRALKKEKRTHVICAILVGLGKLDYKKADAIKIARKYHRKDTGERHKAAARYFGYIKYKGAFRLLAEHLDEPYPENVNSPSNPPASWWEERYKEWQSNVPFTRWAIAQLVEGETFESESEAKQWAESEGGKHGISWER